MEGSSKGRNGCLYCFQTVQTIISILKKQNIHFAGIDLVSNKLIGDINITSPTGLKQYKDLEQRIKKIVDDNTSDYEIVTGKSVIGGGTLPNSTLDSPILLMSVNDTNGIVEKLLRNTPPIITRITDGKISFDLRSVFENQDGEIAKFLNSI